MSGVFDSLCKSVEAVADNPDKYLNIDNDGQFYALSTQQTRVEIVFQRAEECLKSVVCNDRTVFEKLEKQAKIISNRLTERYAAVNLATLIFGPWILPEYRNIIKIHIQFQKIIENKKNEAVRPYLIELLRKDDPLFKIEFVKYAQGLSCTDDISRDFLNNVDDLIMAKISQKNEFDYDEAAQEYAHIMSKALVGSISGLFQARTHIFYVAYFHYLQG